MALSFSSCRRVAGVAATALLLVLTAAAQSQLAPTPLALDTLAAFQPLGKNWQLAGGLAGDPRHDSVLTPTSGTGVLINNPTGSAHDPLVTTWRHGDLELDLDFLLSTGASSEIYLQGRYAVELRDSWAVREPTVSDGGGIAPSHAPLANASRAPGLWQHLHLEFKAPRFSADGKKTANARFTRVVLNDFVVQEDVEISGPTGGVALADEKAQGPLVIAGGSGAMAVRAIALKQFDADAQVKVEKLAYQLYAGEFQKAGEYDSSAPKSVGVPVRFSQAAVEKNGMYALVFTGSLVVPHDGVYGFTVGGNDPARLLIDDRQVVVQGERGGQAGTISLKAGSHPFRLDYLRNRIGGRPWFEVTVEGPGVALHSLTTADSRPPPAAKTRQIFVEPTDRVLLQRCFVPYEPKKRLYAASIGTPAGVHYAYDFETGALLRVWRGRFLDTSEMWIGRGENQIGKAAGPALTLNAKPTVALIEFPQTSDWPVQPDAMQSSQGYSLEPDGQPVFFSLLSGLTIRDRIAPTPDARGLVRTMNFGGQLASWEAWVLIAEADVITAQPDGHGWIIGDRGYYLDWPADSAHAAIVRTRGGHQQLVVPLTKATLMEPLNYTLVW